WWRAPAYPRRAGTSSCAARSSVIPPISRAPAAARSFEAPASSAARRPARSIPAGAGTDMARLVRGLAGLVLLMAVPGNAAGPLILVPTVAWAHAPGRGGGCRVEGTARGRGVRGGPPARAVQLALPA